MSRKKVALRPLKLKRAAMFIFCSVFFLFPGQNYYLVIQNYSQPAKTKQVEVSLPLPSLYPVNLTGISAPSLTARAAVILDGDSAVLLHGKNEKVWLLPASTVKIMTALVALDYFNPNDVLKVGKIEDLGQEMDLLEGEEISVRNLFYGLLVSSANDAALVLAQGYPGGEKGFVQAMNRKAGQLHLNDTYFANPTGLESDQSGRLLADFSYTTALDLARLTSWALKNPIFREIIATQKITVTDVGGKFKHELFSLNELLGKIEGLRGVKTGWTQDAGECFVSLVERDGKRIITVVLGSQDRFGETAKLINWAFVNHRWQKLTPSI